MIYKHSWEVMRTPSGATAASLVQEDGARALEKAWQSVCGSAFYLRLPVTALPSSLKIWVS